MKELMRTTYAKSGTRSDNSDRNQNNDYRRNSERSSYRNSERENNSTSGRYGDRDRDIYESEFSRYDDGYDDNYSSPAYSMRSGNYNSGRNTEHDESNPFRRVGQKIREGWRNMMDDDDEGDYRNDFRNTRDDDDDERYMGRYDRNYPDNRQTNSYGSYDRRDTYGRENDRVNSSRGYEGRSSYGSRGYDSNREYREGNSGGHHRNNTYNSGSGRSFERGSSYERGNSSDRNNGYGGYQNSSRKSYDTADYRNHNDRNGHEHRTPHYDDGRNSRKDYNTTKNGYGSTDRNESNRYGESWRNHFSW